MELQVGHKVLLIDDKGQFVTRGFITNLCGEEPWIEIDGEVIDLATEGGTVSVSLVEPLREYTAEEKVRIYESFLISLHTAQWTGNQKRFAEMINKVGAFSYARTNSNGDEEYEEYNRHATFEALKQ